MRYLISLVFIAISVLHLSGQDSSKVIIYGTYRVPDEISLGVGYNYRSLFGFSVEGGYNIGFNRVLDINGTLFNFEDFYALPEADRGPFCRFSSNIFTGDIGFGKCLFYPEKGWGPDTQKFPDHDMPSERTHMEYMEYGLDLNYNLQMPGVTLYGGIGHRYGVFEFDIYEINREPVVRSRQQKEHFPVLNIGLSIKIKEWHFSSE